MSKLAWVSGADGARATPGALLRWRDVKRGPWQYGYYRGVEHGMLTFSLTADGPITLWSRYLGPGSQMAVVVPTSPDSGEGDR